MKTNYKDIVLALFCMTLAGGAKAQCGTAVTGGSSSNLFTHIRNSTNPVAADKVLNTVVFIHRNNAGAFGGNSGQLRYDVSFNAGTTWTLNQGILNPLTTNLGRYPNVAIYNPASNATPSSAYLGYLAATINATTSAWNGVVTGVRQLNGSGNTENYNQPVTNPQLIAHSLVKGAPGIFWSVDALFNGSNITGFTIYKGQWNNTSNDIVWANNFTVTPSFNTGFSSIPQLGDYNIAFDPTGTFGWFSFLGHVSPGPSNYALYPVFYKTTNGGTTWTGPFQVDLNTFSCLTGNISGTNVLTTNFEHDLTVDVNGNPHLFTTICNGSNAYGVYYTQWHHVYDITMKNGLWVAYDVANVMAGRGTFGTSPNITTQDMSPQVSRSADGTKVFFTWTDNSSYTLGQANQTPNLFGKGYNVTNNTWTSLKDFSSCNSSVAGQIMVPHVAAEVLEPVTNQFKLAPVYGVMTSLDPALTANFNFLDNVTFSTSDFTVNPPASPTIAIAQGTNVLLCPNSTITINLSGPAGQAIWSNGATTLSTSISSPTISTYSVIAQQNCNVGTASISVTNMSVTSSGPSASVCIGNSATLTASGNALTYSWMPGNLTGTSVVVTASNVPVYTLTAGGNANCVITDTVSLGIFQLPTVTIAGTNSLCYGSVLSLTASGAATYTWSNGSQGAVSTTTPNNSTSIICFADDANGCQNSNTVNIQVLPVPTITAVSDKTVVCSGGNIILSVLGASTYSWSTGSTNASIGESPTVTTVYTVTGYDANLCSDTKTVSILVNPKPTIVVSCNRPVVCVGEKAILTATGAASYFWSNTATASTIQIAPNNTTTLNYVITGTSSAGCVNTATYTQVVSACTGLAGLSTTAEIISVYPNPNNGSFVIKGLSSVKLTLVNELGEIIKRIDFDGSTGEVCELNGLSSGVYFIVGIKDSVVIKQKIIVSK
ncbi:MAG: T9SS type A sorting domain-containing protein [Bacteroidia bacterium]|nr:T9SS type A sorting domain-containing protein [Bacteroidia bacterium]